MLRTLRLVLGAVAVLVASSAIAQPPAGSDLFPLKAKSKWVYKTGDKDVVVIVVGPEKYNNEDCIKVETTSEGQPKGIELYSVKADGIYRVKVGEAKCDPPIKMLGLPAKKGDSWKVDSKVGGEPVKGEFKIIDDKAKVKTPAGEFEAVLVECAECEVSKTKMLIRHWFVPGKGLVKVSYTVLDDKKQENSLEVKEYVPGN